MDQPGQPEHLTLAELDRGCAEETDKFLRRQNADPRYCYELFRRAIRERDEHAWQCVYQRYTAQVGRWVERHPAFVSTGEDREYFVNRAFERLSSSLTPDFPCSELRQVLRYLQMCVHSVIMDHVRAAEHAVICAQVELPESAPLPDAGVESQVVDGIDRDQLWQVVSELCGGEQEYAVMYASYVLGLKPAELCRRDPRAFPSVQSVYRIKENVLARLRRDPRLKLMFEDA
jgi:hypothetical protein